MHEAVHALARRQAVAMAHLAALHSTTYLQQRPAMPSGKAGLPGQDRPVLEHTVHESPSSYPDVPFRLAELFS